MTDINYYLSLFNNYCERFVRNCDSENTLTNIKLKINHSKNVMLHCEGIAKDEKLDNARFFIAQLCGLFHDIGRFEQFTKYKTFRDDESVYHGKLGVDVLRKENFLKKENVYIQRIVELSTFNHGLISVPRNLTGDDLYFSNITRDADKADIFGIVAKYYNSIGPRNIALEYGLDDLPLISDDILESFLSKQLISKFDLKTLNDFKMMQLAWIFDLNFNYTKRFISEKNYPEIILSSISDEKPKDKIRLIISSILD